MTAISANAAKRSADTQAKAYQATLRAQIKILPDVLHFDGPRASAYFTVLNSGSTDATIVEQAFALWFQDESETFPVAIPWEPEDSTHPTPVPALLRGHARILSSVESTHLGRNMMIGGETLMGRFGRGYYRACFSGRVLYTDESGATHEVIVTAVWDANETRFSIEPRLPPSFNFES